MKFKRYYKIFSKKGFQTISVTITAGKFDANKVASTSVKMVNADSKIVGTLTDAKNGGAPLAGVVVSISADVSATSGSDGKFVIENLSLDAYTIKFEKEGYASIERIAGIDEFVDGVFSIEVVMGGRQILRDKTIDDLNNSDYLLNLYIKYIDQVFENYLNWAFRYKKST